MPQIWHFQHRSIHINIIIDTTFLIRSCKRSWLQSAEDFWPLPPASLLNSIYTVKGLCRTWDKRTLDFPLWIFLYVVSAEMCRETRDCRTTSCVSGSELHCVNHQCTCTTAASGSGGRKSALIQYFCKFS